MLVEWLRGLALEREWLVLLGLLLVAAPATIHALTWVLQGQRGTKSSTTTMTTGAARAPRPLRPASTLPLLGNTLDFLRHARRVHDWAVELCIGAEGRPVLLTALGRPDMLVLSTPEAFDDVFRKNFEAFPKGPFMNGNLRDILGHGIFAVDHARWVHQRKTASNLFTARSIRESMTAVVRKHTATLYRILDRAAGAHERVDLFKLFNRFTIESFAEIGFGIEMNCLDAPEEHPFQTAFDSAQRIVVLRFMRPSWFWRAQRWLGVGIEAQLARDIKVIDDTVLAIISQSLQRREERRRDPTATATITSKDGIRDIVSLFLDNYESSAEAGQEAFDPVYLRDIVVNFLIAGRDTTAQALSWFFLSMGQHPHVADKIRQELGEILPELVDRRIATPNMEQVQQLTYLEAALRETLRLYPSVPFNNKEVTEDVVLSDGTFVPKNTTVGLPSYCLGRMPHVWGPDAAEFKPERWLDPATGKLLTVPAQKFIAFNAGPRLCLGMNLAMMEMKIVVASLLSRFDIRVQTETPITYDVSLTLPVRGEMLASVTALAT